MLATAAGTASNAHYNYFRDYDPATGRYVQADPIGQAGGINVYLYAKSNPERWIDPLGLDECRVDNAASDQAEYLRVAEDAKIMARYLGDQAAYEYAVTRIDEFIRDYDDARCCGPDGPKPPPTPRIPPTAPDDLVPMPEINY